ncbi:MAG: LysR family transcriptional regulator [Oscillospiraceae bacterium]|nr:LysR family transcriptional regulator [Oscillospiraceae bacterium]
MDINQIRSFLAVTQTLNFNNAAKESGVPQSTISRQISELEHQLGVPLFYRTRRKVELTAEGRTFLPYAQEMLEASQLGARAVRQLHTGGRGRLAIATVVTGGTFLTGCLREFGQAYPNVVVDIRCVSSGGALQNEGEDPYDFHLLHADMLPESGDFDTLLTHSDQLCVVAAKGFLRGCKTAEDSNTGKNGGGADKTGNSGISEGSGDAAEWSPRALGRERMILLSEEESPILYMMVRNYFHARRVVPNVVNESGDVRAVLLAVAAGLGVTVLPSELTLAAPPGAVEVLPLPDMDEPLVYAAAWKRALCNPAARLFLDVLRRHAAPELQ